MDTLQVWRIFTWLASVGLYLLGSTMDASSGDNSASSILHPLALHMAGANSTLGLFLQIGIPLILAISHFFSGGHGTGSSQLLWVVLTILLFLIPNLWTPCLFVAFIVIGIIALPSAIAGLQRKYSPNYNFLLNGLSVTLKCDGNNIE